MCVLNKFSIFLFVQSNFLKKLGRFPQLNSSKGNKEPNIYHTTQTPSDSNLKIHKSEPFQRETTFYS